MKGFGCKEYQTIGRKLRFIFDPQPEMTITDVETHPLPFSRCLVDSRGNLRAWENVRNLVWEWID